MKKFLPYILIVLIVVQLLAPFTVGSGVKNNLIIQSSKAEASIDDCKFVNVEYDYATTNETPRPGSINLNIETTGCTNLDLHFSGVLKRDSFPVGEVIKTFPLSVITSDNFSFKVQTGENHCSSNDCETIVYLTISKAGSSVPEETYTSKEEDGGKDFLDFKCTSKNDAGEIYCDDKLEWQILSMDLTGPADLNNESTQDIWYFEIKNKDGKVLTSSSNYSTKELCDVARAEAVSKQGGSDYTVGDCIKGTKQFTSAELAKQKPTDQSDLPECSWDFWNTLDGCFAQLLYHTLFKPTSFLFGLTGKILDFTLFYSISDTSYRSTFVVEGWGIVRDFCNMFFIFVLLYIAIGTILNLHSVKTKEAIINVVIIGLLINFSLFATQVIIDTSNIITRVFYNQKTIAITEKDSSGKLVNKSGEFGEIRLSEAIVSKANPVKLITQAKKAGVLTVADMQTGVEEKNTTDENISTGAFILVVILAIIVNIVGMIAFLSCALIFITRVLGLWLAMILAPIAFFSYTVPGLKDMKMIGWTKWWPDTLKMAFLAPVFAFFMYLIVGFMDKGLGILNADSKTGMSFVVAIIVPFVFIMLLLMQAKKIATNMSGEMGQSITKGIAAVGGIALGGAALGTAMLGRGVGNIMGKAAGGETSSQKYANAKRLQGLGDNSAMDKLSKWQKAKGATGKFFGMHKIYGTDKGDFDIATQKPVGVSGGIGGLLNRAQKKSNKVDKARDITDADIEKAGFKGMKWGNMSSEQKDIVIEKVKIENYTKWIDEADKKYREEYDANPANIGNPRLNEVDTTTGKLRDLTPEQKEGVKNLAKSIAVTKFEDQIKTATTGVNAFVRAFSKANTGTWDVRNLSNAQTDKRASVFTKIPVGLIAAVATGVRGGILKSSGLSHGTVKIEGKFLNDLKSTLSDSLKSIKVELPETHGSENAKKVGHGSGH